MDEKDVAGLLVIIILIAIGVWITTHIILPKILGLLEPLLKLLQVNQ